MNKICPVSLAKYQTVANVLADAFGPLRTHRQY